MNIKAILRLLPKPQASKASPRGPEAYQESAEPGQLQELQVPAEEAEDAIEPRPEVPPTKEEEDAIEPQEIGKNLVIPAPEEEEAVKEPFTA